MSADEALVSVKVDPVFDNSPEEDIQIKDHDDNVQETESPVKKADIEILNQSLQLIVESPIDTRKAKRNTNYIPEKRARVETAVKRKIVVNFS